MERVPFFSLFCVVLLLLSSDAFKALFAFFHLRFFGFLHFFSLSSEFSFHWEKTDCFVTSFDLPLSLSLSLFHARYIYTRANTVRSAYLRKGEKARFLRETEFVFESC